MNLFGNIFKIQSLRLCFGCKGLGPNIFGLFRYLLPYNKLFHYCGVQHDIAYLIHGNKEKADLIFLKMCLAVSKNNIQKLFAYFYYFMVKTFGFIFYY